MAAAPWTFRGGDDVAVATWTYQRRRVERPRIFRGETSRGDAAAATRIYREETRRGDAAAATRTFGRDRRATPRYAAAPASLLLVVVACNADLATADALRLAAEADPDGSRTVGVLTKPDLMDPGTESGVEAILEGRVVRLPKHGYRRRRRNLSLSLAREPDSLRPRGDEASATGTSS